MNAEVEDKKKNDFEKSQTESNKRTTKPHGKNDLIAPFDLLYLLEVQKNVNVNVQDIWSSGNGINVFCKLCHSKDSDICWLALGLVIGQQHLIECMKITLLVWATAKRKITIVKEPSSSKAAQKRVRSVSKGEAEKQEEKKKKEEEKQGRKRLII